MRTFLALFVVCAIAGCCCVSDPPKQEDRVFFEAHKTYNLFGAHAAWVEERNHWMQVSREGSEVSAYLGLPESFEKGACKDCRYWMKFRASPMEGRSVPASRSVIEILEVHPSHPCKVHGKR